MLFHPLYQKLCTDDNLNRAWRAVRRLSEAPGLDGMTAAHFESRSFVLLKKLQNDLLKFKYAPQPVKRIFMRREVGPPRPLGIPTFIDRIVQRALVQILIPLLLACARAVKPARAFRMFRSNPIWMKAGNCCGECSAIMIALFRRRRSRQVPINYFVPNNFALDFSR